MKRGFKLFLVLGLILCFAVPILADDHNDRDRSYSSYRDRHDRDRYDRDRSCEEGKVWRDGECRDPLTGGTTPDPTCEPEIVTVEVPVEVPGPIQYVDREVIVEVPGPTEYVEVPVEVIVEVPGPTEYVEVPVEVEVPGPTEYVPSIGNKHAAIHAQLASENGAQQCLACHQTNGAAVAANDTILCSQYNYRYPDRTIVDPMTNELAVDPVSGEMIVSGGHIAVIEAGQTVRCRDCHYPHNTPGLSLSRSDQHAGCIDCH